MKKPPIRLSKMCECGHTRAKHWDDGPRDCGQPGCRCSKFTPVNMKMLKAKDQEVKDQEVVPILEPLGDSPAERWLNKFLTRQFVMNDAPPDECLHEAQYILAHLRAEFGLSPWDYCLNCGKEDSGRTIGIKGGKKP